MQHLFQSTFLQALGFAIAYSIWQTAIVWLLYLSITGLLHRTSAAIKYRIGVTAQIIGFCWFLLTFQFYYRQYSHAWQSSGTVSPGSDVQLLVSGNVDLASRIIHWMIRGEQFLPYISMAYLLLIVFLSVRWIMGYQQTQQIRFRGLQKMPVNYRLFVSRIAEQLGISRKIQVYLSDAVSTPLTIGFFKPVILVPLASINHLSTEQMEAVLLHELAHIKRYDYLVNILLSIAEISLFFNPFTQLLSRQIRKERENSCDDWVLQYQYNAGSYAEALLRIACLQTTPALAMTATGKKNELLVRVKRMIDKKENQFNYRRQLLAFVLVTGILSSIAWLNPIQNPHSNTTTPELKAGKLVLNKKQPAYSVEPVSAHVDNPLFNPVFFLSKPLQAEMKKNIDDAQKEISASLHSKSVAETPSNKNNWVTSITPLVAGALEQASHALDNVKSDIRIPNEELAKAKAEMARSFQKDSLFFTPAMQEHITEAISQSREKSKLAINTSKRSLAEMARNAREISIDKQKMQKDIDQAMQVMKQFKAMGLEKVINDVLEQTKNLYDTEKKSEEEKQNLQVPIPKNIPINKNTNHTIVSHPKVTVAYSHFATTDNGLVAETENNLPVILVTTDESKPSPVAITDMYIDPVAGTLVINDVPIPLKTVNAILALRKAAMQEKIRMKRIPAVRLKRLEDTLVSQRRSVPLFIQWQ